MFIHCLWVMQYLLWRWNKTFPSLYFARKVKHGSKTCCMCFCVLLLILWGYFLWFWLLVLFVKEHEGGWVERCKGSGKISKYLCNRIENILDIFTEWYSWSYVAWTIDLASLNSQQFLLAVVGNWHKTHNWKTCREVRELGAWHTLP